MIDVEDLRGRLLAHPLYELLNDAASLRIFMRFHAFAVWDFLSLLKSLQQRFTCVEVPWRPVGDPVLRRLINEIVLDEESDIGPGGHPQSHFEIYLDAMRESGADRREIDSFAGRLGSGEPFGKVVSSASMPKGTRAFVQQTIGFAENAPDHVLAAVFSYGREEIIPDVFRRVVNRLNDESSGEWEIFRFYLQRHIETDEETHAPLARKLVADLCRSNPTRWMEAEMAARESLQARLALWDCIQIAVEAEKSIERRGSDRLIGSATHPTP